MNNRPRIGMLLLAACLVPGSMRAQSTSSPVSPSDAAPGLQGETDAQQTGTEETVPHQSAPPAEDVSLSTNKDPGPIYVSALDGTGLISQDEALRGRLLLGLNYSGGYDTNPDGLESAPKSGAFLISPFVGLQGNSSNLHYVVQYQPSFRHYTSSRYDGGSMQVGSGNITGRMNERWSWDGLVSGRHGQDSIGLLAPQQSVPVGDVPGTVPAANAFNPNADTITSIDGQVGLTYLVSERGTLGFKAENGYTDYTSLFGNSLIGTVSTSYAHAVSPVLQWLTYASATRYYGFVHCYAYGGGAGLEWKPEEHTYLHLSGGPQVNSTACGKQQGFTYNAAYSRRLTPHSQVYVQSARAIGTSDLGPGLWDETASIGYQLDFEHRDSIAFDFEYYTTTGVQSSNSYSGKYVDATYNRILGHGLRAIFSYRWYAGGTFQSNFTRTTALLSIAWTPTAGHLFQ